VCVCVCIYTRVCVCGGGGAIDPVPSSRPLLLCRRCRDCAVYCEAPPLPTPSPATGVGGARSVEPTSISLLRGGAGGKALTFPSLLDTLHFFSPSFKSVFSFNVYRMENSWRATLSTELGRIAFLRVLFLFTVWSSVEPSSLIAYQEEELLKVELQVGQN